MATVLFVSCRPTLDRPPNVLLVVADTLRAAQMGAYGYSRDTTPNFDRLAASSFLFDAARAQAPCTFPSVNSLLTSKAAERFYGREPGLLSIPDGMPTMAERFADAGYATVAISASPVVRKSKTRFNRHGGFDRGFQIFDEDCLWGHAECVNERVENILGAIREPFFLYVHYLDPHGPYQPPETWQRRFAHDREDLPDWLRLGKAQPRLKQLKETGVDGFTDRELSSLRDLYDEEIAYFDSELRSFLDLLRARDAGDRTLLWIVGDHGEQFGEDGDFGHCQSLSDTEIRTPMLLRLPGQQQGRRISGLAANLDVLPTTLDLLGIDVPSPIDGTSLRPLIERDEPVREFVPSGWGHRMAVFDGRFKLVADLRQETAQLYDLRREEGESRDVAAEHPGVYRARMRDLRAWRDSVSLEGPGSEETKEFLEAVGYL